VRHRIQPQLLYCLVFTADIGISYLRLCSSSRMLIFIFRHGDCPRTGGPRGRSSSLGTGKAVLVSTLPRIVLSPTHPFIQWTLGTKWPGREAD
jgi:hypothetical protein